MKELLTDLIARLGLVPGLKDVRVFNNQVQHLRQPRPDEELALFPPAFVEIASASYQSYPLRTQSGDLIIRVHVVNESLTQGSDMAIYELKDRVNQYLYGFTTRQVSPLLRSNEETDVNHDNLFVYKIDYQTRFTEKIEEIAPQTAVISAISIAYDLDVDNPVIRTGDNSGYRFGPAQPV